MDNQQPAATAGQPNGVYIDANTAAMLQQQGVQLPYAIPGQPVQQTFQQPTPNPAPAGTMTAMGANQGGWTVQHQATHQMPNQAHYAAPQRPLTAEELSRITTANGQTEPGSPLERKTIQQQLQAFDNLVTQAIDQGVERRLEQVMSIFGNQQQQGMPQQMVNGQQQAPQPFFDTTTGKIVIGAGGIGVGVLGTKLFSNVFGGGNSNCSSSDANAFVNALKQLLR